MIKIGSIFILILSSFLIGLSISYKPKKKEHLFNYDISKVSLSLEQVTTNGHVCDFNRIKNKIESEKIKECREYNKGLIDTIIFLENIIKNIDKSNCEKVFLSNAYPVFVDVYKVMTVLILTESQDLRFSFANMKLAKEMMAASEFIGRIDLDNCKIIEKE